MRKDQPKLKKQFDKLENEIRLLKRKLAHRERVIVYLFDALKDHEHQLVDYVHHPMPF